MSGGSAAERRLAAAACRSSAARFRELFGDPVPRGRLVIQPDFAIEIAIEEHGWRLDWPSLAVLEKAAALLDVRPADRDEFAREHWTISVPHEIGHLMVGVRFPGSEARGADVALTRYGTPLPDWLDEALAIWMEPAEHRESRLIQARESSDPPLASDIMSWRHELAERGVEPGVSFTRTRRETCTTRCPPGDVPGTTVITRRVTSDLRVVVDTTRHPPSSTPREPERPFYPMSFALLAFVHERGGARAIAELTNRLRIDPLYRAPLVGLPGLPDTDAGVEAAWRAWLSTSAR